MLRSLLAILFFSPFALAEAPALPTVAEATNYKKTSTSGDVSKFCDGLSQMHPRMVTWSSYGTSHEGKPLNLLAIADPSQTPKPCVLIFANIHAGEVDGKEAVLALARELAGKDGDELRKSLAILIAPNINPDGNDRMSDKNRREQNGPVEVGTRANAQGLDLNRDFVKLESPEIRALVKLINERNPLVIVDCHTTNGSKHRYKLTYDCPRYAAADDNLVNFSVSKFMPAVAAAMKKSCGFDSYFYGNFADNHTKWETYATTPRYGIQYFAMRNRFGILSESYSYATYEERVKASYAFTRAVLDVTAKHLDEMNTIATEAEKPKPRVMVRTRLVSYFPPTTVLGYDGDGQPKDYELSFIGKSEPTEIVERTAAYLIPKKFKAVAETLMRHGIRVEEVAEEIKGVPVDVYSCDKVERDAKGRWSQVSLEVSHANSKRDIAPGDYLVRTEQPLGNLAAYFLEPQSEDGVAIWNLFGDGLRTNGEYPALRLKTAAIHSVQAQEPQDKKEKKKITPELLFGGGGLGGGRGAFAGGGFGTVTWLDGEHWLQSKGGSLQKVNAITGESVPAFDAATFKKSLETITGLQKQQIDILVRGSGLRVNADRTAVLVDTGGGPRSESTVWAAFFDGKPAVELIGGGPREFLTWSPKGTHIAFVRTGNLYVVDLATQKTVQLTTDGGAKDILNGRGDWVYEEEIFNRNGQAYWWSPDGQSIAFLRFDDTPVKKFTVTPAFPAAGKPEVYGYPKPGDPNPLVQLGVAKLDGSKPTMLPLGSYRPEDTLISRVGWTPKNEVYAYIQNRTQTWLDFTVWKDGQPVKLFRDQTKAWIEDPGAPKFLADGSFIFLSERDGWKHAYHYAADGKLVRQVTKGDWAVKDVHRIDEKAGAIYASGNYANSNGSNLVRASLTEDKLERLTTGDGTHSVSLAPTGDLYIDRFSSSDTPSRAVLRRGPNDEVRKLDSGAANSLADYKLGKYERTQIETPDGFKMEAAVIYPPDFDPAKKYPIWLRTYAGPHAPTVHDSWSTHLMEQVLAGMGIVVLNVDPRSASGKGAVSAWTCYRQLGVQELKDLECAVDWICKNDWADKTRVGMSGHSYGGYITAYALTHSKKFSAGIAGAPVTDWRLYDSIYTERYMGLPDENKKGYDDSSCIKAAKNLHGKLLILHGLIDDNVHLQNTMQFADALQQANKPFELMIYPRSRHGIGGRHYQELQIDFIKRTMLK